MRQFKVQLFDTFQLEVGERPITAVYSDKVRLLLAYLCVEADQPHSRQKLASLLWGEQSEAKARTNLRNSLVHLRRLLQPFLTDKRLFSFNRQTLQFHYHTDLARVDVLAFIAAMTEAETDDHTSLITCDSCCQQLSEAVALYQGDFLATLTVKDSPPFEGWRQWQEQLHQQMLWACQQLADYFQKQGNYELMAYYARRQLQLEAWREGAHRQLMVALASSGQKTAALRQYELCRQLLADELGIEPATATKQLYQQIKAGDKLGRIPHNLPRQFTPFVGREAELSQLQTLWKQPENSLITIVGPGGMGKTRLGLAFAEQLLTTEQFRHGVYFINLAPLSAASHIVTTVADALNFPLQEGHGRSPKQQLLDYLRAKKMLLLFDNFEHLLAGVGLLTDILQAAPEVQLLVTSRERLRLRAEQVYPIEGLAFPDWNMAALESEITAGYTAVQLFLQLARRIQPDFVIQQLEDFICLARICHIVAGMPLALELAASWVDMMPLANIAAELQQGFDFLATDMRDMPERHRSVRTAIDYSWQKLNEKEQAIFAKLSVFRGGFTREAAQSVAGANLGQLSRLVNKSLLQGGGQKGNGRYQIHELLRQYGAEKLSERGEETDVSDRHAAYYATFLQQHEADLNSSHQQAALAEIEADSDNLHISWYWAVERRNVIQLNQALKGLCRFYKWSERYQIGEAACRAAIERLAPFPVDRSQEIYLLAKLLIWQGFFNFRLGSFEAAVQQVQKSLTMLDNPLLAEWDVRSEQAEARMVLGHLNSRVDHKQAPAMHQQSLALYRTLDNQWELANTLTDLGGALANLSELGKAGPLLEEALLLHRKLENVRGLATTLDNLSFVARGVGEMDKAEGLARESIDIWRKSNDRRGACAGLASLGLHLMYRGKMDESVAAFEESLNIATDLGDRGQIGFCYSNLAIVAKDKGDFDQAQDYIDRGLRIAQETENNLLKVNYLWSQSSLALARGAYVEAEQWARAASKFNEALRSPELQGYLDACLGNAVYQQGEHGFFCQGYEMVLRSRIIQP